MSDKDYGTKTKTYSMLSYIEKKNSKCMQYLTAGSIQGSSFDLYTYTKETNEASSRNSLLLTWDMISTISIRSFFLQPKQCLNKNPKFLA